MNPTAKLNDVFSTWKVGGGVFTLMQTFSPPWATDFSDETYLLDNMYHGSVSGGKTVSPLICNMITTEGATNADRVMLVKTALSMFGPYWTKEYAALSAEYNPIENYNMVEDETPAETTETDTPAETTRTITPAETTETITPEETTETVTPAETTKTITPAAVTHTTRPAETTDNAERADGIFGFNNSTTTSDPANDSKGKNILTVQTAGTDVLSVQSSGSEADTTQEPETRTIEVDAAGSRSLEVDNAGTDSLTVNTAGTRKFEVDAARHLTRSGNIGTTTTQMMLLAERDLWRWNFFRDVVFPDLDSLLVLGIY